MNAGYSYREQVQPAAAGRVLLDYLSATYRHSSREEWAGRCARKEIEIDGVVAHAEARLAAGQTIVWHRPPWQEPEVPLDYRVLYEDDALLAVDKPRGLPTMAAGGFLSRTLLALVRERYPGACPLHRLGRHTSGLVLFARTAAAASTLAQAWRDRLVTKTYRALGAGIAAFELTDIDARIGPVPHPRLGFVYAVSPSGRTAHSRVITLARREEATVFAVTIATGRPHQIRIHLAAIGHPLIGDRLYAAGGVVKADDPALPGDDGYLLHAESLRFTHPTTGAEVLLTAPVPTHLLCS
jgi:23S rRNA pseudouridine1911/1915/1917 synthase